MVLSTPISRKLRPGATRPTQLDTTFVFGLLDGKKRCQWLNHCSNTGAKSEALSLYLYMKILILSLLLLQNTATTFVNFQPSCERIKLDRLSIHLGEKLPQHIMDAIRDDPHHITLLPVMMSSVGWTQLILTVLSLCFFFFLRSCCISTQIRCFVIDYNNNALSLLFISCKNTPSSKTSSKQPLCLQKLSISRFADLSPMS